MTKSTNETFFELFSQGRALADEADDYIDKWHDSGDDVTCKLHEFLGLKWEEYQAFVSDPTVLPLILKARNERKALSNVIEIAMKEDARIAARSRDIATLRNWLAEQRHHS